MTRVTRHGFVYQIQRDGDGLPCALAIHVPNPTELPPHPVEPMRSPSFGNLIPMPVENVWHLRSVDWRRACCGAELPAKPIEPPGWRLSAVNCEECCRRAWTHLGVGERRIITETFEERDDAD